MSLLPYFFDDFYTPRRAIYRPRRLWDQQFGIGISPEDILTITTPMITSDYTRPWRNLAASSRELGSSIKADKDKFQINLDVQHFSPEEIAVKTADGYIVIEGKHEEKKDEHGYISRHFVRRYALPDDINPEAVESRLSSDGVLSITAPRKVPDAVKGERNIPISHTGPVRREIKDEQTVETEKKEDAKEGK